VLMVGPHLKIRLNNRYLRSENCFLKVSQTGPKII